MGYTDLEPSDDLRQDESAELAPEQRARPRDNYALHALLFILTFASTALWSLDVAPPAMGARGPEANIGAAILYASLLMFFLTAHEFGHYFAAKYHGVDATLPYYIPMPFFLFGTLGAVIRTRQIVPSRKAMFDIGVAGPLAGFVVALAYLIIGMVTLPGIESLYAIHPEQRLMPVHPDNGLHFGGFLLFDILKAIFIAPGRYFPPMNEIYHYPFLAIGWFGMFVTALNMIPVGQLDGGHVVYAMFGDRQPAISRWFVRFLTFVGLGGIGLMLLEATRGYNTDGLFQFLQSIFGPAMEWIARNASWWFMGWFGWLLWSVLLRFVFKIEHPPSPDESPLDRKRMVIGWVALAILVLTFSWKGVYDNGDDTAPQQPGHGAPRQPAPQQPESDGPII